jgi:hypothetical protein
MSRLPVRRLYSISRDGVRAYIGHSVMSNKAAAAFVKEIHAAFRDQSGHSTIQFGGIVIDVCSFAGLEINPLVAPRVSSDKIFEVAA